MHQEERSGHVPQHWPNVFGVTRVKDMGRLNIGSATTEKEWWSEECRQTPYNLYGVIRTLDIVKLAAYIVDQI